MRVTLPIVLAVSLVSVEVMVVAAAMICAGSGTIPIRAMAELAVVGGITLFTSYLRFHPEWVGGIRRAVQQESAVAAGRLL